MKKYEVPMYGYVHHLEVVEANSPEEAIKKAYKIVDRLTFSAENLNKSPNI